MNRYFDFKGASVHERAGFLNELLRVIVTAPSSNVSMDTYIKESGNSCGTVACLLGHAMCDPVLSSAMNIAPRPNAGTEDNNTGTWHPTYADWVQGPPPPVLHFSEVFGPDAYNTEIAQFLFSQSVMGPSSSAFSVSLRFPTDQTEAIGRILLLLELNESGSIEGEPYYRRADDLHMLLQADISRFNAEATALAEGGVREAPARFDSVSGNKLLVQVRQQVKDNPSLRYGQALVNSLKESGHVRYPVPSIFYSRNETLITGWFWNTFVEPL